MIVERGELTKFQRKSSKLRESGDRLNSTNQPDSMICSENKILSREF